MRTPPVSNRPTDKALVRPPGSSAYALRDRPAPLSRVVCGLLDRSRAGFRRLKPGGRPLTVVVVFVTFAAVFGIAGLGATFDATIDREVTVDNPDRPPESTCEAFGEEDDSLIAERCDQLRRIDVVVGGLEAYHDLDRGAAGAVAGVFAVFGFPFAAV